MCCSKRINSLFPPFKEIPLVGVIYDPYRDEMFTAIKNGGSFLNGHPIHVREDKTLHDSVVGYATNYVENIRKTMMRGVIAVGDYALRYQWNSLLISTRSVGSAALHLAWVAAGRLTGYWELALHPVRMDDECDG